MEDQGSLLSIDALIHRINIFKFPFSCYMRVYYTPCRVRKVGKPRAGVREKRKVTAPLPTACVIIARGHMTRRCADGVLRTTLLRLCATSTGACIYDYFKLPYMSPKWLHSSIINLL